MRKFDFSNPDLYNHVYIPLLHDSERKRYNILYGGRDSGKSDFIAQANVIDTLKPDYFKLILVRRYYASIKSSQFETIIDYIKMWNLMDFFHITENPLMIKCTINDNTIFARGLDKPDNTKSIKDPTAIWFEEVTQITENAFTETDISLRTSKNAKMRVWASFNPCIESHWVNSLFFPPKHQYEKEDGRFHFVNSTNEDAVILHTTYHDNRFITQDRIRNLESKRLRDENYYKVNTLGLWGGALRGLIYPNWTPIDEFPEGGDVIFGLDYGFNDPAALVMCNYKEKRLSCKELIYVTNHTHQQLVNLILTDYRELTGKNLIIVDSAVPELITALQMAGFNAIPAVKGPDSVLKGIQLVKDIDLCVTKDSSNVIHELERYIWKEDKGGNLLDVPVDVDNHALDALRYVVQTYGQWHWTQPQSSESGIRRERNRRSEFSNY